MQLIDMLRKVAPDLADPGYTALQEDALADIAADRAPLAAFMQAQVDATREFSRTLLDGKLTDSQMVMHACPACGGSRCAKLKSKAGNAYHRCMDCQAAFGDDGGKPGKRFEDRPQGDGAQKTSSASSAAATGPKCPTCKKPTFKNETKTGKVYYRCGGCKGAWWPDRKDEGKLGTKWGL